MSARDVVAPARKLTRRERAWLRTPSCASVGATTPAGRGREGHHDRQHEIRRRRGAGVQGGLHRGCRAHECAGGRV